MGSAMATEQAFLERGKPVRDASLPKEATILLKGLAGGPKGRPLRRTYAVS